MSRPSIPADRSDPRYYLYDYESFSAFLHDADTPFGDYQGHRASINSGYDATRWTGTATFRDAVKLAWDGWDEGTKALRLLQEGIEKRLVTVIPQLRVFNDVTGGAYDIEALMRGDPEPGYRFERVEDKRRSVDVTVNVSASAAVQPETMVARGGLVAALVFALDRLHVPSRVTALHSVTGRGGEQRITRVLVKGEGEPLNPGKVAYALGHPSMLRRLLFCHYENSQADSRQAFGVGYGYGRPSDIPEQYRGEVHLDKAGSWDAQWRNPQTAMTWIMERLAELGVLIGDE